MGTPLTDAEFDDLVLSCSSCAFRLELQPEYDEPVERAAVTRFLAGHPDAPTDVPGMREYFEHVKRMTREGRRIERVRVHETPPTPYQRWERWVGRWNTEAGETIHYLTRQQAEQSGLLPGAGPHDWWLIDSSKLIVMRFDKHHRHIGNELLTDQSSIERARAWRDLAVRAATGQPPAKAA